MIRVASICLLLYWLALFAGTHLPSHALPKLHWSDKAYHAIAFAGLAFLLAWALPFHRANWQKHMVLTLAIATIYAGLDELTQALIPSRTCDMMDFWADFVGIGIGLVAYLVLRACLLRFRWGQRLISSLSR